VAGGCGFAAIETVAGVRRDCAAGVCCGAAAMDRDGGGVRRRKACWLTASLDREVVRWRWDRELPVRRLGCRYSGRAAAYLICENGAAGARDRAESDESERVVRLNNEDAGQRDFAGGRILKEVQRLATI
jgi:hypothetical protein